MATLERLEIRLKLLPLFKGDVVLPRLALIRPVVYLHQDKGGRANWTRLLSTMRGCHRAEYFAACLVPHSAISVSIGLSDSPCRLRAYSTLGCFWA